MKLETFFEKFDQFADAPDAVDELRKIVLHLAVRGALVDQCEDDEPAKVALQRLSGRKLSFLDSEELPRAWESVALGELLVLQKGKKPSSLNTEGYGLPYLDIAALERGEFRQFTEDDKCPRSASGDLVIVCDGSRSGLVLDGVDGVLGSTVSKIGYLGFLRDYLKLFLRSLYDDLNGAKKGAAIPHLNIPRFLAIPAPIPPLAEQKRIVAKVDELMALCDRLEAQQQEREARHAALARASLARFADAPTPANLPFLFHPSYAIPPADLRKSILTLAVQGKLVPQDPNDEPAEEIVSRVKAERHEVTEAPIDEAEMPWSLPSCWQWVRLGGIANIKHGYAFSSESFTSEPTRHVLTTPGNFYESGGFRDRGANTKYFNGDVPPAFVFNPRDLIIPMTEQAAGLLGSPAFIPDDGKTYLHNQRLGKLEFYSDEVAPEYVFWFFNSEFFRSELARTCTGMKVRHTSPKRILKVPFALPPLAEQRRIVAKVEQLMALVDALETQLAASRATAANLLTALVTELTSTPQRADDET